MKNHLREFRQAVRKAIAENHAKGLPVYQVRDGYIVAIYPGGRVAKLQKTTNPSLQQ